MEGRREWTGTVTVPTRDEIQKHVESLNLKHDDATEEDELDWTPLTISTCAAASATPPEEEESETQRQVPPS